MTTVGSPLAIPMRRAIAAAVRPWSPVTTMIRMPAWWQRVTASATSGRGGSSIATSPSSTRSCSASSRLAGGPSTWRSATASTRRPSLAYWLTSDSMRSRSAASSNRDVPSASIHGATGRKHRLRRSLRVDAKASVALVDRGHQLQGRIEVKMCSAPGVTPSLSDVSAEVSGDNQQRLLGRIPAGLPVIAEAGVVAVADRLRERPQRGRPTLIGRRRPPRSRSSASPRSRSASPASGSRSGFPSCRCRYVGRTKRLDRAQALDDRALTDEAAHADRQGQRDHRQQALRHVADDQPDREDDCVPYRQAGPERRQGMKAIPGSRRSQRSARRPCGFGVRAGSPRPRPAPIAPRSARARFPCRSRRRALAPPRRCRWSRSRPGPGRRAMVYRCRRDPPSADGRRLPGQRRHVDLHRAIDSRASAEIRSPSSMSRRSPGTSSVASISGRVPSRTTTACVGNNFRSASTARSACCSWAKAKPALRTITTTTAIATGTIPATAASTAAPQSRSASG